MFDLDVYYYLCYLQRIFVFCFFNEFLELRRIYILLINKTSTPDSIFI